MNYAEPTHILNCVRCHPEAFQIGVTGAIILFLSGLCIGLLIAFIRTIHPNTGEKP